MGSGVETDLSATSSTGFILPLFASLKLKQHNLPPSPLIVPTVLTILARLQLEITMQTGSGPPHWLWSSLEA